MAARDETVVHRGLLSSPGESAFAVLLGTVGLAVGWVWLTGQLAALVTSGTWPAVSPVDVVEIATRLPGTWGDPAEAWPAAVASDLPGPFAFYGIAVSTACALGWGVWVVWRRWSAGRGRRGFASATQLRESLSPKAALVRADRLRPHLNRRATPRDVSLDLGRSTDTGIELAVPIESSIVVMAPTRSGKSSQLIIPWVADWPGPAVVTSVRPDVALNTYQIRKKRGPVAVLDLSDTHWPDRLAWSATSGCEAFDKGRDRSDLMVTIGKTTESDSTNSAFFGTSATHLLAGWLHAAAITGRGTDDILTWALDESNLEPISLLGDHPRAQPGVAALLEGIYRSPADTRSNMFSTVMTALAPLLSDSAKRVFSPAPGTGIDIEAFLRSSGTIYIHVSEQQAGQLAPLISAFVDEVIAVAKRIGDADPTGRCDPPLGMILDEIANVAPLPHAPQLMSYAAGSGICMVAVLQNMAAARGRWGDIGAEALWSGASTKIALGGLGGDDAERFAALAGEYREQVTTPQHSRHGGSIATSLTDRKTLTASDVRGLSLAKREALVIHADVPAAKTRLMRHYQSRGRKRYAESVTATQTAIDNAATPHPVASSQEVPW